MMTGEKTNSSEVIGGQMRQYADQMAKWTTKSSTVDDFETALKYGELAFKTVCVYINFFVRTTIFSN